MTTTNKPTDEAQSVRGDVVSRISRTVSRFGWLRSAWVALLAGYCLVFAGIAFFHYLTFDQDRAIAPMRPDVPYHYFLFALHVNTGAVAISVAWMQVWPWLRNNYPKVHRVTGRIYFFAGVFPAGLLALPNAVLALSGQAVGAALFILAVLWLGSATAGLRATLQHRYEDHHRWMVRNVAMTTSIVSIRTLRYPIERLMDLLPYPSPAPVHQTEVYATIAFTAIIVHLLIAEWFVLRPRRRRPGGARRTVPARAGT